MVGLNTSRIVLRSFSALLALLFLSSCASYAVVANEPLNENAAKNSYSLEAMSKNISGSPDTTLILSFSGGGTRAAALAYGVLEALRDIEITDSQAGTIRLLDEVEIITSVSGGSFVSAYYGLFGDRIFEDFKEEFLYQDIDGKLLAGILNPFFWFGSTGRTEMAIDIYEEEIFHGKTFADMKREGAPLILINASDLSNGIRFSFVQEYFDLLCSDLSSFPVARAVAASSAVPVVFNPVVVGTYPESCDDEQPDWVTSLKNRKLKSSQIIAVLEELQIYIDERSERQLIHFVDGGITDNLGLRAIQEIVETAGGVTALNARMNRKQASQMMLISVDASTQPETDMDLVEEQPSVADVVSAVTDVQLRLYNRSTIDLMERSLDRWTEETSVDGKPITPYFVKLQFNDLRKSKKDLLQFKFLNRIPTSFSLSKEEVNELIKTGRELLLDNPEFKRFMADRDKNLS